MPIFERHVRFTIESRYSLELPPAAPPRAGHPVLLALHGFGDDGARLRERLSGLSLDRFALLCPDAPYPVEMRAEKRIGYAWYQYTGDQPAFVAALALASSHLERVLEDAARAHPIDLRRVAVLGYSQGGYLAGVLTLGHHARFRGLIAIASRIKTEAVQDALATARGFPVLAIHGERDEHVKLDPQRAEIEALLRHGVDATLHVHLGGHGLSQELVPIIDAFTRRVLGVG